MSGFFARARGGVDSGDAADEVRWLAGEAVVQSAALRLALEVGLACEGIVDEDPHHEEAVFEVDLEDVVLDFVPDRQFDPVERAAEGGRILAVHCESTGVDHGFARSQHRETEIDCEPFTVKGLDLRANLIVGDGCVGGLRVHWLGVDGLDVGWRIGGAVHVVVGLAVGRVVRAAEVRKDSDEFVVGRQAGVLHVGRVAAGSSDGRGARIVASDNRAERESDAERRENIHDLLHDIASPGKAHHDGAERVTDTGCGLRPESHNPDPVSINFFFFA